MVALNSKQFTDFLNDWNIHHRLSSVGYAQSNGRAEVGVKTMKRILRNNLSADGSLNNNNFLAAILQYRNTPLPDINLSPAQILFHRQLFDTIPTHRSQYQLHKEWVVAANEREKIFSQSNKTTIDRYNQHTKPLKELTVGTNVLIQDKNKKWKRQGVIVECLPYRQYRVKVKGSGRLTLQNRRFLRACKYAEPERPSEPKKDFTPINIQKRTVIDIDTVASPKEVRCPSQATAQRQHLPQAPKQIPRMLRNLRTYNKPGLLDQATEEIQVDQPRTLRKREMMN